jgi:hypothetical protein
MIEWQKGLDWFNNVNSTWQDIIGARVIGYVGRTKIREANDGVVLAESAAYLPKATHIPVKIYPNENSTVDINKGSTHMQVRNDAGLKKALNDLFDGKHDKWFKTVKQ